MKNQEVLSHYQKIFDQLFDSRLTMQTITDILSPESEEWEEAFQAQKEFEGFIAFLQNAHPNLKVRS